ncbi:MAG: hypothetical protein IKV16_03510 [Clostridia bacterium]|nr:hypothetical protein [Clostridia bacterium]
MKNKYVKSTLLLFVLLITLAVVFLVLTKSEECTEHIDADLNGKCDNCETTLIINCINHSDSNLDGKCDDCNTEIPFIAPSCTKCVDIDENNTCDVCGKPVEPEEPEEPEDIPCSECVDSDENGVCDVCGEPVEPEEPEEPEDIPCSECVDSDENGACDVCGEPVEPEESEEPEDIPCSECVDLDENGACDVCGESVEPEEPEEPEDIPCSECVDSDKNGACDVCGEPVKSEIEYEINAFLILGKEISDYVIAYNDSVIENTALAEMLQTFIFEKSGTRLETVNADTLSSEKYFLIKSAPRSGGDGFYVTLNGENLEITSEFCNKTLDAARAYLNQLAKNDESNIEFNEHSINVRDIFYESFGAVGDGVSDDAEALIRTHRYANEYGH